MPLSGQKRPPLQAGEFAIQPPYNPYNQPPISDPNVPSYSGGFVNNSGQGAASTLPAELQGVNFGAFLMNWIWAIAHSTWLGLLCLVPCLGIIMGFVLLFKGNEYAWQNRRWDSIEQFKEVQKKWLIWGVALFALNCVCGIIWFVISMAAGISGAGTTPPQFSP